MLEVFEIGDQTLQACTIAAFGLHPRRWCCAIGGATRRTATAIQLHLNDLGQDGWKFHQLMALLDHLRLGCQIGTTRQAVRHVLRDKQIRRLDPLARGARMPEFRALLGFPTRRPLRGFLVTGRWLR
jgi:hypothetical protein